jgi:hypothetical protein
MLLFYSGDGSHWAQPEIMLPDQDANLMLTYYSSRNKPTKRFRQVWKARKRKLRENTRPQREKERS